MVLGLALNGACSFVFLSASARVMAPDAFALVSVLWSSLFLVGAGLSAPIELELNRSITFRRARSRPLGALVRRTAVLAGSVSAVLAVVLAVVRTPVADRLFRGSTSFVLLLAVGIAGMLALYMARGALAGMTRFSRYGGVLLGEGVARAAPAVLLALLGVRDPVVYGAILALSTFVGAGVLFARPPQDLLAGGDPPRWSALVQSIGHLMVAALLVAAAMNIGTLAVEVLAKPSEQDLAGVLLSGLVVARLPLFLYQALMALTLPRLSRSAASSDWAAFRSELWRLMAALSGLVVVGTIGAALLGPLAMRLIFGEQIAVLGPRDMGLLALSSLLLMIVLTVNQAQLALHQQRRSSWPWAAGVAAFVLAAAWGSQDLLLRVELALTTLSVVAVAAGLLLLWVELRHPDEGRDELPAL